MELINENLILLDMNLQSKDDIISCIADTLENNQRLCDKQYRTTEEQQKIMDEKINEYEKQGYSAKEAKKKEPRNMLQFPIQANTN